MQFFKERKDLFSFLLIFAAFVTLSVPRARAFGPSDLDLREEASNNIRRDETSGENLSIRRVALEALGAAAGTVVVMNAQTGHIITIVNQEWAIRNAFKPCSTIKLVTGVAGVSEHIIAPDGSLTTGAYRLGLDDALAYSNNTYFQKVGASLGNEKLISYALKLGLGSPTGINASGENPGKLPFGNESLRIYSHADDFLASPLQLAVMVSAITNGGKVVVPRIARTRSQKAGFRGVLRRRLELRPAVYERMIPGMIGAASYGTAKIIPDDLFVAGKTGSCISGGTWVGLFASVAPADDPVYSVVVITRGSHARGNHSAAIAAKVYEALAPGFRRSFPGTLVAEKRANDAQDRIRNAGRSGNSTRQPTPGMVRTGSSRPTGTKSENKMSPARKGKTLEELFPTVVIVKGQRETGRPRVVSN